MKAASSTTITFATCSILLFAISQSASNRGVAAGSVRVSAREYRRSTPGWGRWAYHGPVTESFVVVEPAGLRLHYEDWGATDAAATVVLVHGVGSSGHIWDLVGPLLASGDLRVIAL